MTITDKQIWEQARRRIGFHQNRPDGRLSATVDDVEIMSFARDVLALSTDALDAMKWRSLMIELQREIKDGMVIDRTLAHIIKTTAERVDKNGVDHVSAIRKALTLGLQHATWSKDRSRDPIEQRLNEQDVAAIEAALALLPPA